MRRRTGNGLLALALGAVLALAAVAGVAPRAALAEGETYSPASKYDGYNTLRGNDDTVTIDGVTYNGTVVEWYVIGYDPGAGTVTLLSRQAFGAHKFDDSPNYTNQYGESSIRGYVEDLTEEGQPLAAIAGAIETVKVKGSDSDDEVDAKLWLLSAQEASELTGAVSKADFSWWLRSPGDSGNGNAAFMWNDGTVSKGGAGVDSELGVRPALKLNLGSVIFESGSNTFKLPTPEPEPAPEPEPDPEPAADAVPIHRLYNPYSGEHFYTASDAERDGLVSLGWRGEGEGWAAPAKSETPVYRLYNGNAGEHHFTASAAERDVLVAAGWSYEGIGWYSDDARGVAVCREYNPNAFACNHNYTANRAEHDLLVKLGWDDEGVAWYGLAA